MRLLEVLICAAALGNLNGASALPVSLRPHDLAVRQAAAPTPAPIINTDVFPSSPLNATAWALIYTYPLAIFANWAGSVFQTHTVNELIHQRTLASPGDPGIIKPNTDTIYTRVLLDLSDKDIVLTVPNITDRRYWVYPVYDPFGNNLAEIGIANDDKPGDYLIRRATGADTIIGYSNDSSTFNSSAYQGVVNLPGSYATMLIRLLLIANTTENLNAIHKYQNETRVTPIDRKAEEDAEWGATPALESLAMNGSFFGIQTPEQQLEFAARMVPHNPPQVLTEQRRVSQILGIAGLRQGHFSPVENINLTEAAVIANASMTADVQNPEHILDLGNEWKTSIPSYSGNFGTNYAAAAYASLLGYQGQRPTQTLYPGYRSLGFTNNFELEDDEAFLLSFSGKPKMRIAQSGFWSLSVYDADNYLIRNDIDRFQVGDRTYELVYDNGEPIYGPGADEEADGPFHILVQPANNPPPGNWTSNWLPVSSKFSWNFRWYVPEPAMTNGSYVYPKVERVTAITQARGAGPVV